MPKQPFTALDQFDLQSAYDIQVAPNKQWLVYVRHSFDIQKDAQVTRLWCMDIDGNDHRPLTGADANESAPRISPCGTRVAYLSNSSGLMQLHVYELESGGDTQLTRGFFPPMHPSWSPAGDRLAYYAPAPATPHDFGQISAAPEGAEWAQPPQLITRLPYKFDRIGFLPHVFVQVFVVDFDGGEALQLTTGDFDHMVYLAPQNPVWTPDGDAVLICTSPDEQRDLDGRRAELFAVPTTPGEMRQLTHFGGAIFHAAIAPDGERIAFLASTDDGACHPQFQLYVMDCDGSNITELAHGLDRSLGESLDNGGSPLRFAETDDAVYCMYTDQGSTTLGRFTLDGKHTVVAADLGAGMTAYQALSSFGLLENDTLVFNRARGDELVELYTQQPFSTAAPLTNINATLRETRAMGSVEEFWCTNPDDGLKIQGWLVRPPSAPAGKPLPLILDIHGGPHSDYGNRFWLRNQAMAAAGYAVLLVNPRGSTSYGHAFTRGIEHCYPGPDVGDLLAAVDECIDRGWADRDQLFVIGGSGGGTLTAACVARTTRFRAAACLYPVIDWTSLVLTADVTPFMRHWRSGMPWEAQEEFWQHSLLREIDRVTTPTIVMCGSDDHRTPFHQAEMIYQALKFRGVDTALVRFNGEGHGISGRPSHTVQTAELALNWFEKYSQARRTQ